jgi:phosphoenolpyruvate synthase/pyruvate phosphate dikinase
MLRFDERGGLREVKTIPSRAVLSDSMIRHLAQTAIQIRQMFARGQQQEAQDIEWLMAGQQLYIVQSRPYIGEAGR